MIIQHISEGERVPEGFSCLRLYGPNKSWIIGTWWIWQTPEFRTFLWTGPKLSHIKRFSIERARPCPKCKLTRWASLRETNPPCPAHY